MKSVMQEGSSVMKAIEQGWTKAGQPKEFSVKILEEPQKNFIGITIRSAKIALFFDERLDQKLANKQPVKQAATPHAPRPEKPAREPRKNQAEPASFNQERHKESHRDSHPKESVRELRRDAHDMLESTGAVQERPGRFESREPRVEAKQEGGKKREGQPKILWNDTMISAVQSWLSRTLHIMGCDSVQFTIEPQNYYLRVTLSDNLVPDPQKEKQVLASFATLIMETLKRQNRSGLRGYKIILTHKNEKPREKTGE